MPKKKYPDDLKLEMVHAVLEEKKTAGQVAKEYHMKHTSDIQKWVALYKANGMDGLTRKHRSYSAEFKLNVIQDMRENGLSYRQAASKHNVGIHTTIQGWERIYFEEGLDGLAKERRGRANLGTGSVKGRKPNQKESADKDLIEELQRLRMENEYLKKLNALIRSKGK